MRFDLAHLPDDAATLQTLVRDLAAHLDRQTAELTETRSQLAARNVEIETLQLFLSVLRRQQFGRSSEKSHPDQLALRLEAIEEQLAALDANRDPAPSRPVMRRRSRAASRCRSICRARSCGTNPPAAAVPAAAAPCIRSARTSARSSSTSRRNSG